MPPLQYPFHLVNGAPGKEGSHYDPQGRLFTPSEGPLVSTTNAFLGETSLFDSGSTRMLIENPCRRSRQAHLAMSTCRRCVIAP